MMKWGQPHFKYKTRKETKTMKRVRMLLRVSSDQQLEKTGDLSIQRAILKEYIEKQVDWILDEKEYFEGSKSAYKNTAEERDVLQQILEDAKNKEFDILVPYKDDRVGRLMLNTSLYVVTLKRYNVDVYTVKEGCISPKSDDDIEGMMMLMFRYANAQKSSKDTGLRVRDTAVKMIEQGKFMGGYAPFGYEFQLSGEISKHGRALHKLVIIPEKAEVVKYIYDLSLNKEYGSAKIARILNEDDYYKTLAPHDVWKSGTITSILKNPIYAGHTAYKRRETKGGKCRRLDSSEWVKSTVPNEDIRIISGDVWDRTQEKRKQRGAKYMKKLEHQEGVNIIKRNDGMLALVDVAHCGCCGCKYVNGSRYNYWKIKDTGEKRASKIAIYKCQNAWQGVPHDKFKMIRADELEPVVFSAISEYIGKLQENEDVFSIIEENQNKEKKIKEKELKKEKQELEKLAKKIAVMETNIPEAMTGEYPLTLKQLVEIINNHKEMQKQQRQVVAEKEAELKNVSVSLQEWEDLKEKIPTWQQVFLEADTPTKRVLVNKLVQRIDVTKDQIVVRFKINLNDFFLKPRISDGFGVQG